MDCDTTGVEPDFALVKFKKLAGGGYFKIINQSIPPALQRLGYTSEVDDIVDLLPSAPDAAPRAPRSTTRALRAKGFSDETLGRIEIALSCSGLRARASLQQATGTLGEDFVRDQLGISDESCEDRPTSTCSGRSASLAGRGRAPPTTTSAAR